MEEGNNVPNIRRLYNWPLARLSQLKALKYWHSWTTGNKKENG